MSFTWQDIWRIVRRWWWLALLSVTVAAASSYWVSRSQTPLYWTKATLIIGRVMQDPNPNQADILMGQQLAETYMQMVKRKPVLQGAIDSLGLQMDWGALAGRVYASIVFRTQLLEIGVLDTNPQRAKALADAIAEQLILLSPANPNVISEDQQAFARQQLDDLKHKIEDGEEEAKKLKEDFDAAISAYQIEGLRNQIQVLETKISGWQSTYSQLLASLQGGEVNVLTMMEEADLPTHPIGTNTKMNVLLAAAIGFALAVGAVLLVEFMDDSLHVDEHGSESVIGLTVLGTVPSMNGRRYEPRSPDAEMIRQLRTRVMLSLPNGQLKSLVVTSPQPGDGKSSVAANLAIAMAAGGAQVVVVDADLRAPTLHEWFDHPNLAGLADLLTGDETQIKRMLPELLRETYVPSLSLLSAGRPPLDISILLTSPKMDFLINLLSERFDFVLIDSPPTLAAPDAAILAMATSAVLLVVSPERTSRRAARQSRDSLRSREDIHILGIVLNRTSIGRHEYPYYYQQATARRMGFVGRMRRTLAEGTSSLPLIGRPRDPDIVSVSEAASLLGVQDDTVIRWCQEGRLPAVKKGLRWWVKQDELRRTVLPPGTTRRLFDESGR